jgi:hypothetical protein
MAEACNLARPEVRRRASLHSDKTRRQIAKKCRNFGTPEFTTYTNSPVSVDTVNLKHIFRKVETDRHDHI